MMKIYKLQNFRETEYCFNDKGEIILDWSHVLCGAFNSSCLVHYRNSKTNREVYETHEVLSRVIDFNTLPSEIQGLFLIYHYDIMKIKQSMLKRQWKDFLNKYSK